MATQYNHKHSAFTLVEIMIVVAIIGIVIAIALPAFLRAREVSRSRACQENLTKISGAMDQYAIENKLPTATPVTIANMIEANSTGYLRGIPVCPSGGDYAGESLTIDTEPTCSIGVNTNATFAPHQI